MWTHTDLGSARTPERVELVLLICAIATVSCFAMTLPMQLSAGTALVANSFGFSLTFLLVGAQLAYRAIRSGAHGRPWGLVALSLIMLALCNAAYALMADASVEAMAWLDVMWLLGFLPLLVGLALLVRPLARGEGWVAVLDAVVVTLGFFTVAVAVLSEAMEGSRGLPPAVSLPANLLEVFADDILLAIAVGAVHALRWRPPRWIWALLAAVVVFSLADALYLVQMSLGNYRQGSFVDLTWLVSALLFGVAGYLPVNEQSELRPPRRWGNNLQTLVPAALIPAAAIALVLDSDGAIGPVARIAGLSAVTLSGVRLFVAVRQQRLLTEELREARIDSMTSLPNLRGLRSLPKRAIDGSVLLAIDLEGLGEINATFGSAFGDRVLICMSHRIALALRNDDLLARIGGDEFGVVLRRASAQTGARVAEMLVTEIESELVVDGHRLRLSACAGVSSVGSGTSVLDTILVQAQDALHEAKRSGSGLVRSYAGATGIQSQARLRLRAEVRQALRGPVPEIVPYFQPIANLADGRLVCVEALARWKREGQILPPVAFLHEVQQSDSMPALTALMLESSLQHLRSAGIDIAVTVNVPADMVDDMLPHLVRGALAGSASTPDQLIVEVTEEAIMGHAATATQALGELRCSGVRVLLDDFGTGWSGLATLRDLAVDGLKIDGSFTRAMESDPTTQQIVECVASLAAKLGVLVIYEGVEDPAQLRRLQVAGEGLVQGFAVAHPMAVEDLARWIAARPESMPAEPAQDQQAMAETLSFPAGTRI